MLCSCDTVTDKNRRGDGEEVGMRRNSARASKENKTRIFSSFLFLSFFARHPIQSTFVRFVLTVTRSSMKSKKIGYKKNHSKANGGWLCSLVRVVCCALADLFCVFGSLRSPFVLWFFAIFFGIFKCAREKSNLNFFVLFNFGAILNMPKISKISPNNKVKSNGRSSIELKHANMKIRSNRESRIEKNWVEFFFFGEIHIHVLSFTREKIACKLNNRLWMLTRHNPTM